MIPVSQPALSDHERRYLLDAFDSGWISSRGVYIERAEALLREVTGAPYAAVSSNGTTALHLALLAAGVSAGDEVIVPSLTYVASLNVIYYLGATPVIVDVEDTTWCVDPAAVQRAITDRTSAVLAVDLYGQPSDYRSLRTVAAGKEIRIIADAAESIGAERDGTAAGALADVSTFSFFGNKVITSGEGGAVTTASEEVHARVLQLRNQGNHPTLRYHHEMVGYNYRMTNLSAAILTAQLERSAELISARRRVVDRYTTLLSPEPAVRLQSVAESTFPSPWMFSLRITDFTERQRDEVIRLLESRGIESRPVFQPLQRMPFVRGPESTSTPVAERISREGLSLPTFSALTNGQVEDVVGEFLASVAAVRG